MKTKEIQRMERDILEAVCELGPTIPVEGSKSSKALMEKYPSEEYEDQQQFAALLMHLVEERYLFPYFNSQGEESRSPQARGITPKGTERLNRLKYPMRTWIGKNWFPFTVAITTAAIGTASIIVNIITA